MPHRTWVLAAAVTLAVSTPARAQTYVAGADFLFYGDNTEFANPFRVGDTMFGVSGRVFLDAILNDAVSLRGGFFGLGRFGSHEFLEHAEPVIALHLSRGPSRFIFGSLETVAARHDIAGPDVETPHRLLPPMQHETLTFTRGQEMGLQWLVASPRFDHDAWINWQRLNTEDHRERFDAGYRAALVLSRLRRFKGQWHVVHEGGQQFSDGASATARRARSGWSGRHPRVPRVALDGHVVVHRDVPDRERPSSPRSAAAFFTRGAVRHGAWRAHLIVWRGRDALKDEGDPNYLARRSDGRCLRKVRDYGEFGLTRQFRPAPGVHVFAAFRLHRIESHYDTPTGSSGACASVRRVVKRGV